MKSQYGFCVEIAACKHQTTSNPYCLSHVQLIVDCFWGKDRDNCLMDIINHCGPSIESDMLSSCLVSHFSDNGNFFKLQKNESVKVRKKM